MGLADEVRRLARWDVWANSVVGGVLEAAGGEPAPALAAYQHIYETEITWLRRIAGHPSPNVPLWGPVDFAQTRAWRDEAVERMSAVAATADDASLSQTFSYTNSSGGTSPTKPCWRCCRR